MGQQIRGVACAVGAGVCWGSMAVAAQYMLSQGGLTAVDLVAGRLLIAGIMLLLFEEFVMRRPVFAYFKDRKMFRDALIYGLILMSAQATFFLSIAAANAGTAAIMVMTAPIFIIAWELFIHKCPPSKIQLLCLVLTFTGVVFLITKGDFSSIHMTWLGVFWGLVSAMAGAAGTVQPKHLIRKMPVNAVVGWGMTFGGIVITLAFRPNFFAIDWTWQVAASYLYMAVFGTLIAFVLYLSSVKYVSPTSASLLNCFEPLSAVFFSIVLLGVVVKPLEVFGALLIFSAVFLLSWSAKRSENI